MVASALETRAVEQANKTTGGLRMTGSNSVRRSHRLAVAVGTVLAGYVGVAGAAQWRLDNGTQVIWNTSISVGASWRAAESVAMNSIPESTVSCSD